MKGNMVGSLTTDKIKYAIYMPQNKYIGPKEHISANQHG